MRKKAKSKHAGNSQTKMSNLLKPDVEGYLRSTKSKNQHNKDAKNKKKEKRWTLTPRTSETLPVEKKLRLEDVLRGRHQL